MKTFKYLVNGLEVEAKYDEEDIDKVYKPLLYHWYDLYKQKQCRIVIFIAGCPGSGKSTFVSFLEAVSSFFVSVFTFSNLAIFSVSNTSLHTVHSLCFVPSLATVGC